jgi:membrane protein YqaA with SNARE-associated domain
MPGRGVVRGDETLTAVWAFGEACFWFIAPDFLLVPLAIQHPERWRRLGVAAWCGSLAGGAGYFAFCTFNLPLAESILAGTPFVTPRMLASISALFDHSGVWGALAQSWSFMSFKIWTFEAVRHHFSWWAYFPIVMVSRAFRLFVVAWLAARLSPYLREWWNRRPALSWALYTAAFLLMLVVIER